jgi:hypothetical protein
VTVADNPNPDVDRGKLARATSSAYATVTCAYDAELERVVHIELWEE